MKKNTMNDICVELSNRSLNRVGTHLYKIFFKYIKRRYEDKYASGYYITERGHLNRVKGYVDLYLIDESDMKEGANTMDWLNENSGESIKEFSGRPGIRNMKELGRLL